MTEIQPEQAPRQPSRGAVLLRHMRVETDFRRVTQRLERQERDKYSSFLWNMIRMERAPKVSIMEVVGARVDNPVEYWHEDPLKTSVDFYHSRVDRAGLIGVLKFYTVFLLQQARKEADPDKQLFLIFKTAEFARMIVQYSPYSIHADAEALVFGLFHDLSAHSPAQFRIYVEQEKPIFDTMRKLHFSPLDTDARLELGNLLIRQSSYFDALVQYQYLLGRYPRVPRDADLPRGRVFIKIAEIFQSLIDYAEDGPGQFRDARKLRNFIDRYNRDYAQRGAAIPRIREPSPAQIRKAVQAMRGIANLWYQRALAVRLLGPRMVTKLVSDLAANYIKDRNSKEAHKLLHTAYRYWRRVPDAIDSLQQRIEYLNLMTSVGTQLRKRDMVNFAYREIREYQNRLSDLELRQKAEQARREALLAGEEYSP